VPAVDNPLFEVAIVEALNNAVHHNPRDGSNNLHCELEVTGHRLTVRVLDEGARLPVELTLPAAAVPAPEVDGHAWESIPDSGYGLYLIRAVFPEVHAVTRHGVHGVELGLSY
jgi:anti-sigma regulatory factor (Ser/Thr protein kinase)